ncbi:MAG: alpha/beta fold hydrolase [Gammaproteobacteria bacterium]
MMINRRRGPIWPALFFGLVCQACVAPAVRVDEEAAGHGFERRTVWGTGFPHRVYLNNLKSRSGNLHVYIEGDGLPWFSPSQISSDPTPRDPLMLGLMAEDAEPAIYLGRPCYFGYSRTPPCNAWWWTDGRFATEVVDSMAAALARLTSGHNQGEVILIGHSGGGALAMLLVPRIGTISAVVTLAGNLDTDEWTQLHRFSALSGSLNPARMEPLDKRITQLHVQGGNDQNTPPSLVSRFAVHQPHAHFEMYPAFDHRCCWEEKWPEIMQKLAMLRKSSRTEPNRGGGRI